MRGSLDYLGQLPWTLSSHVVKENKTDQAVGASKMVCVFDAGGRDILHNVGEFGGQIVSGVNNIPILSYGCPSCGVERTDYEGPGKFLPECPNCSSEVDPQTLVAALRSRLANVEWHARQVLRETTGFDGIGQPPSTGALEKLSLVLSRGTRALAPGKP